jgi:hypothetical protein
MSDHGRRFEPAELADEAGDGLGDVVEIARDLEAYAEIGWAGPTSAFEDRVMAAIAGEPTPRLLAGTGPIATLRQAWRLAWTGGRPLAVRVQAMVLVLIAALVLGAGGSLAVVAASRVFTPPVDQSVAPTPTPPPSPTPTQGPTPSPTASPDPSAKRSPSSVTETAEPTETDDHGGSSSSDSSHSGSGGGGSGSGTDSGASSGSGSDDRSESEGEGVSIGGSGGDQTPEPEER